MFIYVIRHKTTGREYVGSTVQSTRRRFGDHRSAAHRRNTRSPLYEAIRQDGIEQFEMELIAVAESYDEMIDLERQAIRERNTLYPNGYNLVRGGPGNFGWTPSEETRAKMSRRAQGRVPWNKGRKSTPAERAKLSRARKGKPQTPARARVLKALSERPVSAATRERMRGAQLGKKRPWNAAQRAALVPMPEAQRLALAQSKREWWASMSKTDRAAHIDKMQAGHERV